MLTTTRTSQIVIINFIKKIKFMTDICTYQIPKDLIHYLIIVRASLSSLHNLLQNGVENRILKKQKNDYSINGEIFYFLFILYFLLYFWSKLWSGNGDALRKFILVFFSKKKFIPNTSQKNIK